MSYKLEGDIIGLDLGTVRTGIARLNTVARIAEPLTEINMKDDILSTVESIVKEYGACAVVAGVPRGLDGQVTQQTHWAEKLIKTLENGLSVPIYTIDEAVTTKKAEIRARSDQSIDSVAAGIILEDFANEVLEGRIKNVSF